MTIDEIIEFIKYMFTTPITYAIIPVLFIIIYAVFGSAFKSHKTKETHKNESSD